MMMSLIDVQCPHCGAQGQIMVPPIGSIVIGPCPQCSELVTVFCGQVLPLDKSLMEEGSVEERREHLLAVLMDFLGDRIGNLIQHDEDFGKHTPEFEPVEDNAEDEKREHSEASVTRGAAAETISANELEQFTQVDLKLLDNKAYFDSIFGGD